MASGLRLEERLCSMLSAMLDVRIRVRVRVRVRVRFRPLFLRNESCSRFGPRQVTTPRKGLPRFTPRFTS